MVKNTLIHFLFCTLVSFLAALSLAKYGPSCGSMCGLYYLTAGLFLLPAMFLLGLSLPIGMKKYPKENPDTLKKRRVCIIFGVVGMLLVLSFYLISFYFEAANKQTGADAAKPDLVYTYA